MKIARIGKHLLANRLRVRRAFPPPALANIERAIVASEARHAGQLRFVVEGALDGVPLFKDQSSRARALDVFSHLRIWDTARNSGVLIYVLLADHKVEIIADRGIDAAAGEATWRQICAEMEQAFKRGEFERGVLAGIEAVTRHLAAHFPRDGAGVNELPDRPVVL